MKLSYTKAAATLASLLRHSDPVQTILGYKYDNKCNFLCLLLSEESKV